jgi:His/Glu/Gln/Arg/opine family amino acid ABC transporter permease subunit
MPEVILRNLPFLAAGLRTTLVLAAWTCLFGTALAAPVALLRYLRVPVAAQICAVYVGFIRGTPVLVVLMLCYFALPALFNYRTSAYPACILGFSVFVAAYCAEDMRAGLLAVPASLIEAGMALGLPRVRVLRLIVLPLVARVALPALFGQYVRMLKYTSVASMLGVSELTGSGVLVNARVFQPLTILAAVAATYLVICLGVSLAGRLLQRHLAGPTANTGPARVADRRN